MQRDTTIEEVCRKYGVSSSMVSRWRQAFQQRGPEVFAGQRDASNRAKAQGYEPGESPDDLKKLIGDQGKQYGVEQTRQLLLQRGFVLSM